MTSATVSSCPRCQAVVPEGVPRGQCVRCLLQLVEMLVEVPGQEPDTHPTRRTLGDYDLLEELGRGGMGIVFRARRRSVPQTVALKLLRGGPFASEADLFRFRHEVEVASQLLHPHIVPILDAEEADGQIFYTMPLIEGRSLDRDRQRFEKDPKPAVALVIKVARALHYAHERGVLHRDLKPGNILLDAQGEPYLTDFGLARWIGRDHTLTQTGRVVGTPGYLSPEQITGPRQGITVASDLFSLGIVLYELLTGQHPFAADNDLKTLERIRHEDPVPPRRLNPSLDRDLETICLKCLEKDPPKRYHIAAALADDLERWQRHEPVEARPAGWTERSVKWVRRHPVRTVTAVALAMVLLSPTAVATWFILRLNHARGHHPVRRIEGHELTLPIFNWNHGRCTDNFAGVPFMEARQQRVRLEVVGVPEEIRDQIKVQVRADWAIFNDPVRTPLLHSGEEFVLVAKIERKWLQDTLLYFAASGWNVGEVAAHYTNAAIHLTLIDRPPYDPRIPE